MPRAPPFQRSRIWSLSSLRRPLTKVREVGEQRVELQPGDEAGEIVGVGADVAEAPPAPDCFGSVRQSACFWPVFSKRLGQPVLRVFGLHDAEVAELAGGDHGARLPDHRIAGVVVGDARRSCRSCGVSLTRSRASAAVSDSGLSQMTWMPALRNAFAIGACVLLGVTIDTASMPSGALGFGFSAISS